MLFTLYMLKVKMCWGLYRADKKTWMDNRIDPKVFKDDDGQLYMYMVRFTDGKYCLGT